MRTQEEVVAVDTENLNQEYVLLASELTYWARLSAQRNKEAKIAKHVTKTTAASLLIHHRALAAGTKTTVGEIEAAVETDADYIEAVRAQIEAEFRREEAQAIADGIAAKKEMIISYGADLRKEVGADLHLMA